MTTRNEPFAPGTPCWVDLVSSDTEKSIAFYESLFGWTHNDAGEEFGGYVSYMSGEYPVAGMVKNLPEMGTADGWNTYIATADIAASVEAATAAGGSVLMPAMPVGDLGSMAIAMDTSGGTFGLWESGTFTGFGKYNEAGGVAWDEYHSRDYAKSTEFYAKVFGLEVESLGDSDEFRYSLLKINGEMVAGMMDSHSFLPEGIPSHWTVYFSVDDVDESAELATSLGATVLRAPEDTPYGRMSDVIDPTGANFKLHSMKLANPQD